MSADRITLDNGHGPKHLAFGVDDRELFRIVEGGNVVLGVELDELPEAAQAFWSALLDEASRHGFRIEGGTTAAALYREAALLSLTLVEVRQDAYLLRQHLSTLVDQTPEGTTYTLTVGESWLVEARRLIRKVSA